MTEISIRKVDNDINFSNLYPTIQKVVHGFNFATTFFPMTEHHP